MSTRVWCNIGENQSIKVTVKNDSDVDDLKHAIKAKNPSMSQVDPGNITLFANKADKDDLAKALQEDRGVSTIEEPYGKNKDNPLYVHYEQPSTSAAASNEQQVGGVKRKRDDEVTAKNLAEAIQKTKTFTVGVSCKRRTLVAEGREPGSSGCGVLLEDSKLGTLVLTCRHVVGTSPISQPSELAVLVFDSDNKSSHRSLGYSAVYVSKQVDLAAIILDKPTNTAYPTARLLDASLAQECFMASRRPDKAIPEFSKGTILTNSEILATDVTLTHGCSGSGLWSMACECIGVNTGLVTFGLGEVSAGKVPKNPIAAAGYCLTNALQAIKSAVNVSQALPASAIKEFLNAAQAQSGAVESLCTFTASTSSNAATTEQLEGGAEVHDTLQPEDNPHLFVTHLNEEPEENPHLFVTHLNEEQEENPHHFVTHLNEDREDNPHLFVKHLNEDWEEDPHHSVTHLNEDPTL